MLLKLYSIAILTLDLFVLLLKCLYLFLEDLYYTIIPPAEKSVAGEIVLITGTGHGIGRELAIEYASLGATVVCVDIDTKGNEETIKIIKDWGLKRVHGYRCDVSNREEVLALVAKVTEEVGPVTVLVNNAGIMPCHPLLDHKPEEIKKIFDVNIFAHYWLLEAILPRMIKNNHGHIVALSSMAGIIGLRNLVPYCSVKFAVRGLMEALAEELRVDGLAPDVHFTTICPYMVDTGLCKKPRVRFSSAMSMVTPKEAASHIVRAMRRNVFITSIPSWNLWINHLTRILPIKVGLVIKDFFDVQLDAD